MEGDQAGSRDQDADKGVNTLLSPSAGDQTLSPGSAADGTLPAHLANAFSSLNALGGPGGLPGMAYGAPPPPAAAHLLALQQAYISSLFPSFPYPAPGAGLPGLQPSKLDLDAERRLSANGAEPLHPAPSDSEDEHRHGPRRRTNSSGGGSDAGLAMGRGSGDRGGSGGGAHAALKEKNRMAQQRFRQRQKCLIEELKTKVENLQQKLAASEQEVLMLRKENSDLKAQLESAKGPAAALQQMQALNTMAALQALPGLPPPMLHMLLGHNAPPPPGPGH